MIRSARWCVLLAAVLAYAQSAAATDLKITDSRGTQVVLTGASIDYGGFMSLDVEKEGLRVMQGDGAVTVKWADLEAVKVTRADASAKPPRVELEITLKSGKKIPATLFNQGRMKLLGRSELGDYSIDLAKVRAIVPVR